MKDALSVSQTLTTQLRQGKEDKGESISPLRMSTRNFNYGPGNQAFKAVRQSLAALAQRPGELEASKSPDMR